MVTEEWRDGYRNGYTQGIGAVVAYLDHIAAIAPDRDADWTRRVVNALRKAAAEIPPHP